jgi:hypothetical protein
VTSISDVNLLAKIGFIPHGRKGYHDEVWNGRQAGWPMLTPKSTPWKTSGEPHSGSSRRVAAKALSAPAPS